MWDVCRLEKLMAGAETGSHDPLECWPEETLFSEVRRLLPNRPTSRPARLPGAGECLANKTQDTADTVTGISDFPTLAADRAWSRIDFGIGQPLGAGGFGQVELVEVTSSLGKQPPVVLKRARKDIINRNGRMQFIRNEISIHKKLRHENIIAFYGAFESDTYVYMILEYAPNGTLAQQLAGTAGLSESRTKAYTRQLVRALEYLHSQGVVHRDVKPANVLLVDTNQLKLADFGSSGLLSEQSLINSGTPNYMAPEMFLKLSNFSKVDQWALGITILECLVGRLAALFSVPPGRRDERNSVRIPARVPSEAKELILQLISWDSLKRPAFFDVARHSWLLHAEEQPELSP